MKSRSAMFLAFLLVCLCFALPAAAQSTAVVYHYSTYTVPGASATSANGINNNNVIVGSFTDSSGNSHGYMLQSGKFTTLNFPGATQTMVNGIDDHGDVVGSYRAGSANPHGFERTASGTFTTIDDPNQSFGTSANGINNSGVIVGAYDNSQGFILQNGTYRTFDAPEYGGAAPDTVLNGIGNQGELVGQVFSGDNWRGFWVTGGTSDVDFYAPLFARDNMVNGVNGREDVVGCHDGSGGFVVFGSEPTESSESSEGFRPSEAISVPGTNGNGCPMSLNYARTIVGTYGTYPSFRAFVAVPVLTLTVNSPANGASVYDPVHVVASASGIHAIARIEVWLNGSKIYQVSGGSLNAYLHFPVGSNEHLTVQAIDTSNTIAKVLETITVR